MLSFVFALWFPDVSFFFTAGTEFRCLISLSESVLSLVHPPVVHLHHNLFGRVSPIVNIFHSSMNKHIQHELHLMPACLPTCYCIATFLLSDVIQASFALLPENSMDTFNDIYNLYIHTV